MQCGWEPVELKLFGEFSGWSLSVKIFVESRSASIGTVG